MLIIVKLRSRFSLIMSLILFEGLFKVNLKSSELDTKVSLLHMLMNFESLIEYENCMQGWPILAG